MAAVVIGVLTLMPQLAGPLTIMRLAQMIDQYDRGESSGLVFAFDLGTLIVPEILEGVVGPKASAGPPIAEEAAVQLETLREVQATPGSGPTQGPVYRSNPIFGRRGVKAMKIYSARLERMVMEVARENNWREIEGLSFLLERIGALGYELWGFAENASGMASIFTSRV